MQYDEEAHAIVHQDVLDDEASRTESKSTTNSIGSYIVAAVMFIVVATSSCHRNHSQKALNDEHLSESFVLQFFENEKSIIQGKAVSFHPERSAKVTTLEGSDFAKNVEEDLFEMNQVDPLESIINSFASEEDFDHVATMIADHSEMNGTRFLEEYPTPDYLYPLPCNDGVETLACNTPLSSLAVPTDGSPLVIECGTCVVVDTTDGTQLDLPNGLRIEGKLYFPPESSITIRTNFVMVLGILKIDNPLVGNEVKFSLYGEEDIFFTADPEKQSPITSQCVNGCKIGKKAIAVVGGQLDIQGMDESCPSWENLLDISTAGTNAPSASPTISFPPTMDPNAVCAGNIWLNGDFSDTSFKPSKGWGMRPEKHDDELNPGNNVARFSARHPAFGIHQYLNTDCFTADLKKLKIDIDFRLLDGATDKGVDCDPSSNCPKALFNAKMLNGQSQWIAFLDEEMEWNKDGWNHYSTVIEVPEEWQSLKYLRLILNGGYDGTTLLIDNVSVERFVGAVVEPTASGGVDPDPNNQLHLSQEAAGCWTPGSEILITSNTLRSKDYQVATIDSTDSAAGTIKLTSSIEPVSTIASDPPHAVEVALLSRRIVFEADDDADDHLIGGHLIIMLTPSVEQHLEGVEIRNFGQQGNLGRYPVHFHLCDDGFGSVVKKNVVRQSNQRCYVMHGTNGVQIEDNVAFDTFGHCFMTEDGVEHSNRFIRNLGAHTKDAKKLVSKASKRKESDDNCSTFWMSNMDNVFEGNVAAGTETIGYWAETHQSMVGRGGSIYQNPMHKPMYTNLGSFKDNTAHSFGLTGFASYPPGWLPTERAIIENFRAYRGVSAGVFLHNTRMLSFIGGYIAQVGHVGIRVFGADDIIVDGMELVGNIEGEDKICTYGQHKAFILSPLRAPTKGKKGEHFGTKLKNLILRNWSPREDCFSPLISISTTQLRSPAWDAYQLMENINYDNSNPLIADACSYDSLYASDAAIEIKDDSSALFDGSGYLVGALNVPLSGSICTDVGGCLHFCPGACLRSIKFFTSGARDVFDYVMKVSNGVSTVTVDRWYSNFNPESGPFIPTLEERFMEYSSYSISLPAGTFDVWFEDQNNPGVVVYPKFVTPFFEAEPSCSNFATPESINIIKPPVEDSRCKELIHNGDFNTDTAGWQEWEADFKYGATAGVHETGALVTKKTNGSTQVTQWLDLSCLVDNDGVYLFHASYRIVDQVDDLGSAKDIINPDKKPIVAILFNRWDDEQQKMKSIPHSSLHSVVPPTPAPTKAPTPAPTEPGVPILSHTETLVLPHLEDVFPLSICQGKCIADDDCKGNLGCKQREGNEPVPGCAGEGTYGMNYCYDKYLPESTGFTVISGAFTITPEQAASVSARIKFFHFESNFILDHVSLVKAPWSTSGDDSAADGIFV